MKKNNNAELQIEEVYSEETFEAFTRVVNKIKETSGYVHRVDTEIVDLTFVVSTDRWYVEFSDEGYFNLCSKEGCGIDKDSFNFIVLLQTVLNLALI